MKLQLAFKGIHFLCFNFDLTLTIFKVGYTVFLRKDDRFINVNTVYTFIISYAYFF